MSPIIIFYMIIVFIIQLDEYQSTMRRKMTCNELAGTDTFNETDVIGTWNVVFTYNGNSGENFCQKIQFSAVTAEDIEDWRSQSNYSNVTPVVWSKVTLKVTIFDDSEIVKVMALERTSISGQMYALMIPDYFRYYSLVSMETRIRLQLKLEDDYLISMACNTNQVSIQSRLKPNANEVEAFAKRMRLEEMGTARCVPGAVPDTLRKDDKIKTLGVDGHTKKQDVVQIKGLDGENMTVILNMKEL